ncbi:MAG TPA: hypothetical protein DD670_02905, partial [Planctomycetaceae bacterium]|nr:hypothetical protein [Planctomycetaceae bacterium]
MDAEIGESVTLTKESRIMTEEAAVTGAASQPADLAAGWEALNLTDDIRRVLGRAPSVVFAGSIEELYDLACGCT